MHAEYACTEMVIMNNLCPHKLSMIFLLWIIVSCEGGKERESKGAGNLQEVREERGGKWDSQGGGNWEKEGRNFATLHSILK